MSVPLTQYPHQPKMSLVLLIMVILTGVRQYLITALIYIFLLIKDVEYILSVSQSLVFNLLRTLC